MKRFPIGVLLLAGCLRPCFTMLAQEHFPNRIVRVAPERLPEGTVDALRHGGIGWLSPWRDVGWLREEVDPIYRARRALHRRMEQEARQAVESAEATQRPRDPQVVTEHLRITLGNNTDRSWSPYPDRELDARMLRFPLPRDARADKRPPHRQELDRIRSRNR